MDTQVQKVVEVANELGVSASTVYRAMNTIGQRPQRGRLDHNVKQKLSVAFGSAPTIDGRSRSELFVLAALSRSPFGLRSIRAVARRAAMSPTATTDALNQLVTAGLVAKNEETFVEGRITVGTIWEINHQSVDWQMIAPLVGKVTLAEPGPSRTTVRIPPRLGHHFWTGSLYKLDLIKDGLYIASRLALSDDPHAISWAAKHLSARAFRACARARGLTDSQRHLLDGMALDARPNTKSMTS